MEVLYTRVQSLLSHLSRILSDSSSTYESIESFHVITSQIHHLAVLLISTFPDLDEILSLLNIVRSSLENVMVLLEDDRQEVGLPVFRFFSGNRGRPRLEISRAVLEYMIGSRFTVRVTANLLNVSSRTARRYMNLYGITVRSTYTSISDPQLDQIVGTLSQQHPNSGYRLIRSHLAAMGYRVQSRVRESLQRIDPIGIATRWFHGIYRRMYSVTSPNALWHIDGNHKLIR